MGGQMSAMILVVTRDSFLKREVTTQKRTQALPPITVTVRLRGLETSHDCRVDVAGVMPPEILGRARQHGDTYRQTSLLSEENLSILFAMYSTDIVHSLPRSCVNVAT
jgi:hypothetical protein